MKNKIYLTLLSILFLLTFVSAQTDNIIMSLKLKYDKGDITLQEMRLIEGNSPDRLNQPGKGYTAKVFSFGKKELYSFKFSIELQPLNSLDPSWFDDQGNQIIFPKDEIKPLTELEFVLNLPYYNNAEKVEIFDMDENLILTIDVSKYATTKEESSFLDEFFQKFAPITGSVVGIVKRPVYLFIIIIAIFVSIDLMVRARKKRKDRDEKEKTKEGILKKGDINIGTVTCKVCGNVNSSWRKFCIKCEKNLKD